MNELIQGRSLVLDEPSFYRIYIQENLSRREAKMRYGISHQMSHLCVDVYGEKYKDELRKAKSKNYARSKVGNRHGAKEHPKLLLDQTRLEEMRSAGKSVLQIAKELNTTEFLVRRNLSHFRIGEENLLPRRMQGVDLDYLKKLELFVPGLVETAKNYYEDPTAFYNALYEAHLNLLQMIWFIQDQAKGWRYFREKNKVPKNHVCWNLNRYEALLSLLLLQENIPHVRQWTVPGSTLMADFYFPQARLALESDGGFHLLVDKQKERDRRKEKLLEKVGVKLIRIKPEEVWKHPEKVLSDLKKALSEASSQ